MRKPKQAYDFNTFIQLTAEIHLQLSINEIDYMTLSYIITANENYGKRDMKILKNALRYLVAKYKGRNRHSGIQSVIHPIRAARMYSDAVYKPKVMELLVMLFHDLFEDIREKEIRKDNILEELSPKETRDIYNKWIANEKGFQKFFNDLSNDDQWYLIERIEWMTKRRGESYNTYVTRFFDSAFHCGQALRAKLTDRLDNTLDMRQTFHDPMDGVNLFEELFQCACLDTYMGPGKQGDFRDRGTYNESRRLHQIFKSILMFNVYRKKIINEKLKPKRATKEFFDYLGNASKLEAQRVAFHMMAFPEEVGLHFDSHAKGNFRFELLEAIAYMRQGGLEKITNLPKTDGKNRPQKKSTDGRSGGLDGLMSTYFTHPKGPKLTKQLDKLQNNKKLLFRTAIAFIGIFQNFLNDENFVIEGMDEVVE